LAGVGIAAVSTVAVDGAAALRPGTSAG